MATVSQPVMLNSDTFAIIRFSAALVSPSRFSYYKIPDLSHQLIIIPFNSGTGLIAVSLCVARQMMSSQHCWVGTLPEHLLKLVNPRFLPVRHSQEVDRLLRWCKEKERGGAGNTSHNSDWLFGCRPSPLPMFFRTVAICAVSQ
ncbi:hypothetical protein AOLI_G00108730 [Acnodon oligacanthus]